MKGVEKFFNEICSQKYYKKLWFKKKIYNFLEHCDKYDPCELVKKKKEHSI